MAERHDETVEVPIAFPLSRCYGHIVCGCITVDSTDVGELNVQRADRSRVGSGAKIDPLQ